MTVSNFTPVRKIPPQASTREIVDAVNSIIQNFPQFGFRDHRGICTVTANYTVTEGDWTILADASATATLVVTLPAVASYPWRTLNVKKIDSSAHPVIIDGNGAETIDGATTKSTTTQYFSWQLHTDGSAWYIL